MLRASPSLPEVQRSSFPYSLLQIMSPGALPGRLERCPQGMVPLHLAAALGLWSMPSMLQKLQQQPAYLGGLLLLHPVAGAVDQMAAYHVAAGGRLHRLEHARALIGAPILLARDETGGHIDGAARPYLQFSGECARGAAAIPLQAALESGAGIFGAVEGKLAV